MSLVIGKSVSDQNYIGQHNMFMLMWGVQLLALVSTHLLKYLVLTTNMTMLTRTPLGLYLVEFEHHETKYSTIKFPHYVE